MIIGGDEVQCDEGRVPGIVQRNDGRHASSPR